MTENQEKLEEKLNKRERRLIIIIIILIIILLLFSFGYVKYRQANFEKVEEPKPVEKKEPEIIVEDYKYNLIVKSLTNTILNKECTSNAIYQNDYILSSDLSHDIKLNAAINYAYNKSLTSEVIGSISFEELNNYYKEIFAIDIPTKEFVDSSSNSCLAINYENDNYTITDKEYDTDIQIHTLITRTVEKANIIEIYQAVAYEDLNTHDIYKDYELTEKLYNIETFTLNTDNETDFVQYKFTFLPEGEEFYLSSIEKIKVN